MNPTDYRNAQPGQELILNGENRGMVIQKTRTPYGYRIDLIRDGLMRSIALNERGSFALSLESLLP